MSPIRQRGNSFNSKTRLFKTLAREAQSDDDLFRALAGSTPVLLAPQEPRGRRRSSHTRAARPLFVSVAEEDGHEPSFGAKSKHSSGKGSKDFHRAVVHHGETNDELQHENSRLLPSKRRLSHNNPNEASSRSYGSSVSSVVSSNDGSESNTSDVSTRENSIDTSTQGSDNQEDSTSQYKFTYRQWLILLVLMAATLTSSFAVCLFPPFYPRLAEEKGATAAIYGFVIGTNCLTSFLVTPVIGKNLNKFGVLFSMVVGTFIGGLCCAISGFLEFYPPGWCFVVTSSLIRILHATGNALVITATFTYAAMEYQQAVGKIFSLTRTAMNLGQLLGPLVGGALYQIGGFYLPFVTMGALQAFMGLISLIVLKEIPVNPSDCNDSQKPKMEKKITILNILRIPTIWFSFVTFIVATMCNGFLSINLEPKVLRGLHLTPFWVGLLFGLKDGANSLSSPFWGYLCDKSRRTSVKPYLVISAVLVAVSFILMGAGSVFGMDISLSLPMLMFVLCVNGIGVGGEQVVGVVDALHEATNAGYPDEPAMHGIIAGLWSSLSGAGRFVSRVGSGIMVDCVGFDPTAALVTSLQGAVATLTLLYMIFCECSLKIQKPVHWDDVTLIESSSDEHLVFTESASPSESLMGKTVSIDIPKRSSRAGSRDFGASVPHHRCKTASSGPTSKAQE